ncbi:MAG: hypothetical protein JW751_01200 [Polyangiaceae bacterium]|nr:hypothetical protein [Polyangiaceae bacterium]
MPGLAKPPLHNSHMVDGIVYALTDPRTTLPRSNQHPAPEDEDARFDAAFREAARRELSRAPSVAIDCGPVRRAPPDSTRRRATLRRVVLGIVGSLGMFVVVVLALAFVGRLPN